MLRASYQAYVENEATLSQHLRQLNVSVNMQIQKRQKTKIRVTLRQNHPLMCVCVVGRKMRLRCALEWHAGKWG